MSRGNTDATDKLTAFLLATSNMLNDRLPLKSWHRTTSFVIQVILLGYSVPAMWSLLLTGHLDYTPEQQVRYLDKLVLMAIFSILLNVVAPSRRSFLRYLSCAALACTLIYAAALSFLFLFTS